MKTISHSQTRTMRICERKWFLSYGLGAKTNSRDPFLKRVAFLKKLKPSFMWRGDLVHSVIATVLNSARQSRAMGLNHAIAMLEQTAQQQWIDSGERARTLNPKSSLSQQSPILFEHYYAHLSDGLDVAAIARTARDQLVALYDWIQGNRIFEEISKARNVYVDPPGFLPNSPGFQVGGFRFITKVDLGLSYNDRFSIFDWKTSGLPRGDFLLTSEHGQVSFYALWPHKEMRIPIENVDIKIVYVGGPEPKALEVRLGQHDVEGLIAEAELIVDAMKDFLDSNSGFTLEDFDWVTSGKSCYWCPFQEICQRELA